MPALTNFNLVEGEWNDFLFKRITSEDHHRVLEHIRKYFLEQESTCQLLGCTDLFVEQIEATIIGLLKDNLSFLVEEKTSKELAAVRITFRQSKNSAFDEIIKPEDLDWRTNVFLNSIDLTTEQKDEVFSKYNVHEYAELFVVATSPKFRNLGLSMELYKRSLHFLKAEGFKLAKCIFTNPTTRRAGIKLGFQEFHRIEYGNLKHGNGKPIFSQNQLNSEHFAVIVLKQL